MPGDGISPEVVGCAEQVLRALPLEFEFVTADIGFGAYQKHGTPLPEATLETIRGSSAALFGAVTTPPNIEGYFSPVVRMRQKLDLYTNLRPIRSIPHASSRQGIDMLIVRENSEGLYMGVERLEDDGQARGDGTHHHAQRFREDRPQGLRAGTPDRAQERARGA